ncbi:segregation and condensation protein A [Ligilactobacillus equi]
MANEEDVLTFKLQSFEGPLDLLLHLIKQNEMDIYDIEMVAITSQYLDYLHRMKKMQLDIAGEYLVIAATLLNIKSRLLLPNEQAPQVEDETYEDPREELVQQLLLHQAFKEAAANLKGFADERQQLISRPQALVPEDAKLGQLEDGLEVKALQQAFVRLLTKKKLEVVQAPRQVQAERYTIKDEMQRLNRLLQENHKPVLFTALFENGDREEIVTTFLALLELVKRKKVVASQSEVLGDLMIERKVDAIESS